MRKVTLGRNIAVNDALELSRRLSAAQRAALLHVNHMAGRGEVAARRRVTDILWRGGGTAEAFDSAMNCVRTHARVVLHFHPDRFGTKPLAVAEA